MPASEENRKRVEEELKGVTRDHKPQPNYDAFADRLARVLAQAEVDKDKLIFANFNWEKKELYETRFTMLNEAHAKRVAAEGKGYTPQNEFAEKVRKMEMYSETMVLRLQYISKETGDKTIDAALHEIRKGRSQRDIIRDVLALTSVVGEHLDFEGGVFPNGMNVNAEYLEMVATEAEALLHTAGDIKTVKSPRKILVERQRKLITLCQDAITDIKFFAKGAFNTNKQYYKDHYIFSYNRKGTDIDEINEDEDPIDEQNLIEDTENNDSTEENSTTDPQE